MAIRFEILSLAVIFLEQRLDIENVDVMNSIKKLPGKEMQRIYL